MKGRWWILLTLPILWNTVSSDAEINKAPEGTSGRCCPCPDELDELSSSRSGGDLAVSSSDIYRSTPAFDCPCQSREADSVGSPSLFFPTAVRAVRPFDSSATTTKKDEEVKPLLHPEVDLASSVLETLHEVTDKEYRDALARDSARSVARAWESDIAEESPIIAANSAEELILGDDMISEGAHNHETRCLDSPLGRSISRNSAPFNPPNLLTDILKLPLTRSKSFKNLLDWDNGLEASNVIERRLKVKPASKDKTLDSKLDPLNLFSKSTGYRKSDLDFSKNTGKEIRKPVFKESQNVLPNILNLLPKLNTDRASLFGNINPRNVNEEFTKQTDIMTAPSSISNNFIEPDIACTSDTRSSDAEASNFRRNSKMVKSINHLIKPKTNDNDQSQLNSSSERRDAVSDLFSNIFKGLQNPNHLLPPNIFEVNNIFSTTEFPEIEDKEAENGVPNSNISGTQILDTITSPSMIKENGINNRDMECLVGDSNNKKGSNIVSFIDEMNANTNILDKSIRPMKTKIITHFHTNDNNNDDSFESVNDSENESSEDSDEKVNLLNERTKQDFGDASITPSIGIDTITPISDTSGDIPQFDNLHSEEFTNDSDPFQSKSAMSDIRHIMNKENINYKYVPHTQKILNNLGKIGIPEFKSKSTSTPTFRNNANPVGLDDLQKMSDSLLNKDKLRVSELNNDIKSVEIRDDCPTDSHLAINNNMVENVDKMATEASENLLDFIGKSSNNLKSELFPSIVEPASIFDIGQNTFSRPSTNLAGMNLPKLNIHNIFDSQSPLLSPDQRSLSNQKSLIKNMQPLEDINLDIIQLKPISSLSRAPFSNIPSINLNSYKTKLPLPKSLDLKPVILESAVKSNDGGVLDAILTLGKRNNDIFDHSNILKSAIALPGIDEISETLLENAHNLLSTPLETTGRNLIEDTLRSSQVLSENFKVQTKNAVNEIKKNVESSLNDVGVTNRRTLGKSITSNSNILQDISRKHEELEDKLNGIHHDFTDRLETFRSNIKEQLPNLDVVTRKSDFNVVPEPNIKRQRKLETVNRPKINKKGKYDTPRSPSYRNSHLNMIPSSSINRPTILKKPLFELPLLKLQKPKSLNDPLLNLFTKPQDNFLRKSNTKLKTKSHSIAKSKQPPIMDINPKLKSMPLITNSAFKQHSNARKTFFEPKNRQFGRQNTAPSEIRAKYADPIGTLIQPKSSMIPLLPIKRKLSPISNIKAPILRTSLKPSKELNFKEFFVPDDNLLKSRKEALTPVRSSTVGDRNADMLKSASKNVEISTSGSMKENTPYTCKMVCTKNR